MADKKPSPKKPPHPAEPVIVSFFVVAILSAILLRFQSYLLGDSAFSRFINNLWRFIIGDISLSEFLAFADNPAISSLLFLLKVISFGISAFMIWAIFSVSKKYAEVDKKMKAILHPPKEIFYGVAHTSEEYVNPKWKKVLEHVNSENPAEWKLAILEADIILNEMLDKMGYHGATMGDKLKSIEPSDFTSLQEAWEAHKVRNAIAHEGSDYVVNKPEAERVIKLFQKVFKEFKFI